MLLPVTHVKTQSRAICKLVEIDGGFFATEVKYLEFNIW